jgi:RNA polymerase sigma-70 factor (ECF subfamily)
VVKPAPIVELRPTAESNEMGDRGLIAACAAGDRSARALLFERYVDAINRFVTRMRGCDPDAAEDLVHATFMAAFKAAGSFRGSSVRSWLFGIAANVVHDYARSEIRRKRALGTIAATAPLGHAPERPAMVARLPDALMQLSHEQRVAVLLVDLEGERGRDAAAALGIPEGTLWSRVYLARKALRKALGGES